jgi:hypothetical protein
MGFIQGLGLANPTRFWAEDPSVFLEVDLDRGLLCGVGQGDPFRLLSFLGPARWHSGRETWFEFPEKGIIVEAVEGTVAFILAFNSRFGGPRWRSPRGTSRGSNGAGSGPTPIEPTG